MKEREGGREEGRKGRAIDRPAAAVRPRIRAHSLPTAVTADDDDDDTAQPGSIRRGAKTLELLLGPERDA